MKASSRKQRNAHILDTIDQSGSGEQVEQVRTVRNKKEIASNRGLNKRKRQSLSIAKLPQIESQPAAPALIKKALSRMSIDDPSIISYVMQMSNPTPVVTPEMLDNGFDPILFAKIAFPKRVVTMMVGITRAYASTLIHDRLPNRNVSSKSRNVYCEEMETKKWWITHQGIAVDKSGRLGDGQNRLHAFLDTRDVPVLWTLMTFNLEKLSFVYAIDGGLKRGVNAQCNIFTGLMASSRDEETKSMAKRDNFETTLLNNAFTYSPACDAKYSSTDASSIIDFINDDGHAEGMVWLKSLLESIIAKSTWKTKEIRISAIWATIYRAYESRKRIDPKIGDKLSTYAEIVFAARFPNEKVESERWPWEINKLLVDMKTERVRSGARSQNVLISGSSTDRQNFYFINNRILYYFLTNEPYFSQTKPESSNTHTKNARTKKIRKSIPCEHFPFEEEKDVVEEKLASFIRKRQRRRKTIKKQIKSRLGFVEEVELA